MQATVLPRALALVAAAAAVQLAGCDSFNEMLHPTPAIKFAPAGEGYAQKPDLAMVEHDFPLTPDELAEAHAGQPQELQPGADRPDLRAAHRRADPRRRVRRRTCLPEGRERRPPARRDRRRAARPRRRAQAAPGSRTSASALWKGKVFYRDDRVLRNRIEDLALAQADHRRRPEHDPEDHRRRQGPVAAVPGEALLRAEPARLPARVDHHRLLLHRRDPGLPGEARLPRRPQRARGARRDPHGAARVLSRPRLRSARRSC